VNERCLPKEKSVPRCQFECPTEDICDRGDPLAVSVGMAVAAWVIEPATTEAAFPEVASRRVSYEGS